MTKRVAILLSIVAMGLMVAGCDKCGNWFGRTTQSCKSTGPA